ncbi:bifunctional DNA primase/polymerase [Streptomyces sp. NPDC053720]|uniref:bifunctional DNA primase/polymerase n=1 Tax=Streptomyces sp. NPDC053720 TaxID=3154855 RepID=UPI0034182E91
MTEILSVDMPHLHLLAAAMDAARRGWHVFPLRPGDKRPALHGESHCPRTGACANGHAKWEERATTDPDRITSAWTAGTFNIGIATGPSGLVVVDLDMPKPTDPKGTPDGATSLQALCERAGQAVPTTYRVRTASGGHHLYFAAPDGIRIGNSAGKIGRLIDIRGVGGYVVGPGSRVARGAYTVADDVPVAKLPGWLLSILKPSQQQTRHMSVPLTTKASRYAAAALRNEVQSVATAGDGTRNATLLRAARALGRLIAAGDLAREEVEDALSRAATGTGSESQRYYDDVINRALNWSIAHNPVSRRPA